MAELEVHEEIVGRNQVRLWTDAHCSLLVTKVSQDNWAVREEFDGDSKELGDFQSAREAVAYARQYLRSGADELTDAAST